MPGNAAFRLQRMLFRLVDIPVFMAIKRHFSQSFPTICIATGIHMQASNSCSDAFVENPNWEWCFAHRNNDIATPNQNAIFRDTGFFIF